MILSGVPAIRVAFTAIQPCEETGDLLRAVDSLSTVEQAIYHGKTRLQNRLQFLAARLLLRQVYHEVLPGAACLIASSATGRPVLPTHPQWGISISHSTGIVACALHTGGAVGIDVEWVRPLDLQAFEAFFSPPEWEYIRQQAEPERAFFHFWTKKEAISKADGRGLGMDFTDIDVLQDSPQAWSCKPLFLAEGYAAGLAFRSGIKLSDVQLCEINFQELLRPFSSNRL